jgi:DNA topoisomerase-1
MPYIPPGYKNVTIFKDPKSKVYAHGYDKKGRKQIIYNPWFVEAQRIERFKEIFKLRDVMKSLEESINTILKYQNSKLELKRKEIQVALILKLMMLCNFRIGNMKYLKDNGSYGLTTLEWQHIKLKKSKVTIEFVGKKGVVNKSVCTDSGVIRFLQYMHKNASTLDSFSDNTRVFDVSSRDVNAYLGKFGNGKMTAKDIRTWRANYLFVKYFKQAEKEGLTTEKSRKIAIVRVSEDLHNTPSVCKKNYLLPEFVAKMK